MYIIDSHVDKENSTSMYIIDSHVDKENCINVHNRYMLIRRTVSMYIIDTC